MVKISISTLPLDKSKNFEDEIKKVEKYANSFHLDIIDGKFNKNKTDNKTLAKIKKSTKKPVSAHLMVKKPQEYLNKLKFCKEICFHYEIKENHIRISKEIQKNKQRSGLAISPETKIVEIIDLIPYFNYIVVLAVKPGRSGQKYLKITEKKVKMLQRAIKKEKCSTEIYVDGGVDDKIAKNLKKIGVNTIIMGNFIFKSSNIDSKIKQIKNS